MDHVAVPAEDTLSALLPHLNTHLQRTIEGLQKIQRLFPGQSPAGIEKTVRAMQAAAANSVDAVIERLKAFIQREELPAKELTALLNAVKKLALADLKSVAAGISLPVAGTKTAIVAEIRRWVESKGTYVPQNPAERKQARIRELLGDLPNRMSPMTPTLAEEVIRTAETAAKDKLLGSDGFAEFASLLLGISVKGSRPSLLKQIKESMERLVVSHAQSSSI